MRFTGPFQTLFFSLILAIAATQDAQSQTRSFSAQEAGFINQYKSIDESKIKGNTDSVSKKFRDDFYAFIKSNPGTLQYSFANFNGHIMSVCTSGDRAFRIYSWDDGTGGTMRYFDQIIQWESAGRVNASLLVGDPFLRADGEAGSACDTIYTISINNKPHYLAVFTQINSTSDIITYVSVLSIKNGQPEDSAKLFNTPTERLSRISVPYSYPRIVGTSHPSTIYYEEKQRELHIPFIDENGNALNKQFVYQLKQNGFEYVGVRKLK